MVMYCWLECTGQDWEGKWLTGRMICRVKGGSVSLGSCLAAMMERVVMGMEAINMPIGSGWFIRTYVTFHLPKGKDVYLSLYPEPENKPLRLVWEHLDEGPQAPRGGA